MGEYVITPSGLSSENYAFEYKTGTLTVRAKEVQVKWGEKSYTYTGSEFTELPSATADGIGDDGAFTLLVALNDPAQTFKNAGQYVFEAALNSKDAKAKNYILEETSTTHSYTVLKKPIAAPQIASKVYNGTTQTADVVTEGKDYSVKTNDGGIDADDTYEVVLTLNDTANFMWKDTEDSGEKTLYFSITKATYDMAGVTFEDFTIVYDASEHSIGIKGILPNGVTVTYQGNGMKAVGEYTVTANFTGDVRNYKGISPMTALLTILAVSHDLDEIGFEDVTVKYDGEAHSIGIEDEAKLPTNVTVNYEGNGQTDPNIYTVTAVFSDPDGEFARKTATLTILRTYTKTEPQEGSSSGAEVALDSADGFDPTLELIVEKIEDVSRKYWAWEKDVISEKYAVKMCRDGLEVPIDGKVTVRLLIPEAFRDKDFELMAVSGGGAASVRYMQGGDGAVELVAMTEASSIEYTREGDYVIFEADGLSEYVFTSTYTSYFPVIISATGVLIADVVILIVLAVIMKKKRNTKVR